MQNSFDGAIGPTDNAHVMRRFVWVTVCALFLCAVPLCYYRIHAEKPLTLHGKSQSQSSSLQFPKERAGDGFAEAAEQIRVQPEMKGWEGKSPSNSVERICLGAAALLLLWGLVLAMRSRRCRLSSLGKDSGGQIRIVQTRRLGNRQCLAVVACERKKFLIAITSQNIELIDDLDGEERTPQKNAFPEENPS
ncbi:MAG: flagellar biosynthetic protein FliO [Puniceicoccales bacterium]|jgi:flagellar biogenesis protein FliO|nr:flagellar biosynthetic protein FliO [Puniceicoccales bacterium]